MEVYIGIDPGNSGGIAVLNGDGTYRDFMPLDPKKSTAKDLSEFVAGISDLGMCAARLEKVASSPQMGVKSSFTFGQSKGFLLGLLTAHGIPFDEVRPQAWQKELACMSKGNKNVTKSKAERLWPAVKMTHAKADALLIAEYCRRQFSR